MRIFLSVDMEGATGVCHRDHLIPGGQDYERARSWLTGDVNAAVEGALEAGATDVVVADGHGTMRNILLDELHDSARLVTGPAQVRNRPLGQLSGIEVGSYDAAMFIGYHSRAGTPGGLLSHTWVGALVHEIRLNGRAAGEALLNAALLGHYRVPVVFASGADDFCREVLADLGEDLEVVETKKILGPSAVITRTPAKARSLIRAGAARGLKSRRAPFEVDRPVVVELEYQRTDMRERGLEMGREPLGDRVIRYEAPDADAAVRQVWRALAHTLREESVFLK
ncbi:MAG: M55 family metallopeptidase [Planctomycetota bacterium]|jgi:D-amino peptidase